VAHPTRAAGERSLGLLGLAAGEEHGDLGGFLEQLGDERGALLGRLAWPEDSLGQPLAQGTVVVDAGEPEIGEGQSAQARDRFIGAHRPGANVVEQPTDGGFVHADTIIVIRR